MAAAPPWVRPWKITSVARPSIFGPSTDRVTLATASTTTATKPSRSRRSTGVGRERRRRRGGGGRARGGGGVGEEVPGGPALQRRGDGQPLALPAAHVGAALLDGGVEPAGHGGHEVGGLGDVQRRPQL